jgi:hypothetical protein
MAKSTQGRDPEKKVASAKKTAAERVRSGQQRQADAKKTAADRIQSGQQRQAATRKALRTRGGKTS